MGVDRSHPDGSDGPDAPLIDQADGEGSEEGRRAGVAGGRISRRALLGGGAAVAAGVVAYRWLGGGPGGTPAQTSSAPPLRPAGFDGRPVVLMATHLHASFSEGKASYAKHFADAVDNNVDVLWFTEHDWRMSAKDYRTVVHFDSLSGEKQFDREWAWLEQSDPNLASSKGQIVSSPTSPNDPSPIKGALEVAAVSADGNPANNRMVVSAGQSRDNYRGTVVGQTITVDVYPTSIGPDAWLELRLQLSDQPRVGARAPGTYVLSYQLGAVAGAPTAQGPLGTIPIAVTPHRWTTITIRPEQDFARLWPDLLAADNSTFQLWLGATSTARGALSEGVFDYLRFERSAQAGDRPLALQQTILDHYRSLYPTVTAYAGLEVSFYQDHINQYGGALHLPTYNDPDAADVRPPNPTSSHTPEMAAFVAHNGGLGCFDHPLSVVGPGLVQLTELQQDGRRHAVTATLLTNRLYGLGMVEVGYQDRGGMLFDAHFQLACSLWRNSLFVTATGATDDHNATSYSSMVNRFFTAVFPRSRSSQDLVAELRAGHAFATMLGDGPSVMDLRLDDNPMGSVSVRPPGPRTLRCLVSGMPSAGTVEVIRGVVDDAGTRFLDPELQTVQTVPVQSMPGGRLDVPVTITGSAFFVMRVLGPDGATVGFTNPCWALIAPPPGGVAPERRAPDSLA